MPFLVVSRAMESLAIAQIILLLRFSNTGHSVVGCVSDHWVLRNFSHEPIHGSVAAGGWHTLLWLGHWSETIYERFPHDPQWCPPPPPINVKKTDSFLGTCRHGAGQVSVTSELRVSRQTTWVYVSRTLVAHTQWPEALGSNIVARQPNKIIKRIYCF
jgi:hypothetical protein